MVQTYTLDQTFTHTTLTHEYRIRWTRLGNPSAPPLIFIHGTPWSSVVWHDLASTLFSRYSIYLYDHPSFGLSPPPKRLTSSSANEDDDAKVDLDGSLVLRATASSALLKHWNLSRPPHVIAHDNAGLVSLRLLLEHGIKFASLCLIDVVALGPFGLPWFKLVAENEAVFAAIPSNFAEGFVRAYVRTASYKSLPTEVEDQLCAPWLEGGTQGTGAFLKEMVQAHNRHTGDLEKEYVRVGGLAPTKIIWGADDKWLPVELARKLKEALKAEEAVVIEEAGHLIQYDQPSKLALGVGLWLGKHSRDET